MVLVVILELHTTLHRLVAASQIQQLVQLAIREVMPATEDQGETPKMTAVNRKKAQV